MIALSMLTMLQARNGSEGNSLKLSIRDVSMSVSAMSTPVDLTVLVQQFVLFES